MTLNTADRKTGIIPLGLLPKGKKGISPLIATVLLVAFSIALGAIVMNFTETSTKDLTAQAGNQIDRGIKCSMDLSLRILEINNNRYICYNRSSSRNIEIIVENQGITEAKGIQIFLLDYNDAPFTLYSEMPVPAHSRTKFNISLADEELPEEFAFPPTKIIISPIHSISGNTFEVCTDNRIEVEEIERCI